MNTIDTAKNKKVLIAEPHPYHEVLLPGVYSYFKSLNYHIDFLLRIETKNSKVFSRIPDELNIIYADCENFKEHLKHCENYDVVFFTSFEFIHQKAESIIDFLGFTPNCKICYLGILHSLSLITTLNLKQYIEQDRIFSLLGFSYEDYKTSMLMPMFFGNIKEKLHKNAIIKFVSVRAVSSLFKCNQKLFDAVDLLLKNKISNFEIVLIGKGSLKYKRKNPIKEFAYKLWKKKKYAKYIKLLGETDYETMYSEVESSDYILPLLDAVHPLHERYRTECVSGIMLLIFGFNKPCIINEKFAKAYGLNEKNAIIYQNNELPQAMLEAANSLESEYNDIYSNLKNYTSTLYNNSLKNLSEIIKNN